MKRLCKIVLFFALLILLHSCGNALSGTSESGNAYVSGQLVDSSGAPVSGVVLCFLPSDYNPISSGLPAEEFFDTTDVEGAYEFKTSVEGRYTISSYNVVSRRCQWAVLINNITVTLKSTIERVDTISNGKTVLLTAPYDKNSQRGALYFEGTLYSSYYENGDNQISFEYIPVGQMPSVYYIDPLVIDETYELYSNGEITVSESSNNLVGDMVSWRKRMQISVNTAATGSATEKGISHFLLPVTLSKDNFSFRDAKAHGEDIRFRSSKGIELPYSIEVWDTNNELAEIWIAIDTVLPDSAEQVVNIYWGNENALNDQNPLTVYDTSKGLRAVWHFSTGSVFHDASSFAHNGINYGSVESVGVVGQGRGFDATGEKQYIDIGPRESLKIKKDITFSAWIKPGKKPQFWESAFAFLHDDMAQESGFSLTYFDEKWRFMIVTEDENSNMIQVFSGSDSVNVGEWNHIAATYDGVMLHFYHNGELCESRPLTGNIKWSENPKYCRIGMFKDSNEEWGYNGAIDEIQIYSTAKSSDWVKLTYYTQK